MNTLEKSIMEQLGCEDMESFKDTLKDVCKGGANAGFPGFTYSSELSDFYDVHRADILSELKELASDISEGGLLKMVAGFNCLKGHELTEDDLGEIIYGKNKNHEMYPIVIDALCWAVLENTAFRYDS